MHSRKWDVNSFNEISKKERHIIVSIQAVPIRKFSILPQILEKKDPQFCNLSNIWMKAAFYALYLLNIFMRFPRCCDFIANGLESLYVLIP